MENCNGDTKVIIKQMNFSCLKAVGMWRQCKGSMDIPNNSQYSPKQAILNIKQLAPPSQHVFI